MRSPGVGEVELFVRDLEEAADFGAFEVEFHAVGFGVAEEGDEAAGILDEAVHGPGGEGEGFAGLASPEPDLDAVGAVFEGGALVGAERKQTALSSES